LILTTYFFTFRTSFFNTIPLKRTFKFWIALLLTFLLAGTGYFYNQLTDPETNPDWITKRFEKILHRKVITTNRILDKVEENLDRYKGNLNFFESVGVPRLLKKEEVSLLYFDHDTLNAWSDKNMQIPETYSISKLRQPIVFLGNAWYKTVNRKVRDGGHLTGLILIKRHYSYQNQFLKNEFQNEFHLPSCIKVSANPEQGGMIIHDDTGGFLLSLILSDGESCNMGAFPVSLVLMLLAILLFLYVLRELVRLNHEKKSINWLIAGLGLLLMGFNYLIFHLKIPGFLFDFDLFSPYIFAISTECSSLGHLFILSSFIFFIAYVYFRDFRTGIFLNAKNKTRFFIKSFLGFLIGILFFYLIVFIFRKLILDSNISFEPYKVLNINYLSLIGFFSIVLMFISFGLFLYKFVNTGKRSKYPKQFIISWLFSLLCFPLLYLLAGNRIEFFGILFYVLLSVIIYHYSPKFPYIALILFSLFFSMYSTYLVVKSSQQREMEERKVMAISLFTERDPIAELLLEDLGAKIESDQWLRTIMEAEAFTGTDADRVLNFLNEKLFVGYLQNYDLTVTLCNSDSKVLIDEKRYESCLPFFDTLISVQGTPLPSRSFYYLDDESGQVNYLGSFFFKRAHDTLKNGLFIRLDSKLVNHQMGYPELLLDNSTPNSGNKEGYSYAKYKNGKLVAKSGDFKYNLLDNSFRTQPPSFNILHQGGYNHLVYNPGGNLLIVVSQKEISLINLLISFSYFFVFLFFISNSIYLFSSFPWKINEWQPLLKYKIQLSMISIVFFSLVFIGMGTIYFSINQYREKQNENLSEKIQSVYVELDHKLGLETELSPDWKTDQYASLDELLIKFSNVFYTDINLYDPKGNLLATSRPEIFSQGLSGTRIDYKAFRQLVLDRQTEFVQEETIGKLKFLSAYVPFLNQDNQILAYLNLPYFTRQNSLTREITNLVVGVVNFSMVMILIALVMAVVITNQITNPLKLIQDKISGLKLGKKTEPIYYKGRDEIGSLVAEYNRMVDELTLSADALARSEREIAWREMARQIAHEIKNPLTPMKLSIQHLQKSWEDQSPDWDLRLKKITRTLIEQIDNLSSIASAFSSFAQMPQTRIEEVDLVKIIKNAISLFSGTKNLTIHLKENHLDQAIILADESQISRVFNNLIKNAFQSVKEGNAGEINIFISKKDTNFEVKIQDNGEGIPKELEDKLFEPNFTTKSSGMGLGLAIVKKIVEDVKGTISLDTELGKGSVFILVFPSIPFNEG